ncbi:hypothetical protein Aca07nite_78340 [Actinoplanes capillaceus]|uniref:Uncharacterized protein n=1 Tax=Actinoplanes campanulatus TaxID=113559 RepID=A0ABQ3WWB1_9ACTN|nr:hypothetical protein Aca07nite_78340 [Actinoplanes capillaceus]
MVEVFADEAVVAGRAGVEGPRPEEGGHDLVTVGAGHRVTSAGLGRRVDPLAEWLTASPPLRSGVAWIRS